jgi:hypothetical protein
MTSIILKSFALATVLVASAPAFAGPITSPQTTVLKYDAKTQKYCLTDSAMTGSHIGRTTCQTAKQWAALGLQMPKATLLAQK